MEIIDRKYLADVILALKQKPKSFNELLKELKTSPDTIGRRIKDLAKYGVIEPTIITVKERSRIKYQLTKKGREILPKVEEFLLLSEKIEDRIRS